MREIPDMMSASEGGHGKADVVREVACILWYRSVPNAEEGGRGSKNPKILWTSLMDDPVGHKFLSLDSF